MIRKLRDNTHQYWVNHENITYIEEKIVGGGKNGVVVHFVGGEYITLNVDAPKLLIQLQLG